MKILIVGKNSFIGKGLLSIYSADKNLHAFGVSHQEVMNPENDFIHFLQEHNFDLCVNCSGSSNIQQSYTDTIADFEANVLFYINLLNIFSKALPYCKIIQLSSAATYGLQNVMLLHEGLISKPISPYGYHKLQTEVIGEEFAKCKGSKVVSLRLFSAYGPENKKQLLWDIYQKAKHTKSLTLKGTGEESRDFIYIDDIAQAILAVANNAQFNGEVVNVANSISIKINEVSALFERYLGKGLTINFDNETHLGNPKHLVADITTIENWGYSQKINFETGLKLYIKWLQEKQL
jgi:UDP-glucose 4-epimerase